MSRTHFIRCITCNNTLALDKLIYRHPDFKVEPDACAAWSQELTALLQFMSDHITYNVTHPHPLIVIDDDFDTIKE